VIAARRRSFVLIAVLVIVGSALLITTSLLYMTQSEVASLGGSLSTVQTRSLAWSGVQAVMTRLDEQRDDILRPRIPVLDRQYEIYTDGRRIGVVRLLPMRADGSRLLPEASRLDLNAVTGTMLAATGVIEPALADAIIEYRDRTPGRSFRSVAELLLVPGVTPEMLYGPLADVSVMDDAQGESDDITERVGARLEGDRIRGLADVLTVHAVEPAIQRSGRLRINLNVPWSQELGDRVDERFGAGASDMLRAIMNSGTTFDSERVIYDVIGGGQMSPDEWPDIVDSVTTEEGVFHFGRLDINTAPREALLGLPEMTPDQATAIVRMRDELPDEDRATVAWPAIHEIIPADAYGALADFLTVRSWTYRLRLAAGHVDAEDPDGPLADPVIYEVVLDLSDTRTRVAYLRDITLLQTSAAIALSMESAAIDAEPGLDDEPDDRASPMPDDEVADDDAIVEPLDDPSAPTSDPEADAPPRRRRIGRWIVGG
jgi:DNA uptake protein ComE-like DNA-binding protein